MLYYWKCGLFCVNICSFFDARCVCAHSLYLYMVDECMCAQVRMPVAPVPCSITLSLIPLRVYYSLNLELGWQCSYSLSSTVPSPLHIGATVWPHLASDMYGKDSYTWSPSPSCLGILMKLSGHFFANLLQSEKDYPRLSSPRLCWGNSVHSLRPPWLVCVFTVHRHTLQWRGLWLAKFPSLWEPDAGWCQSHRSEVGLPGQMTLYFRTHNPFFWPSNTLPDSASLLRVNFRDTAFLGADDQPPF